MKAMDVYLCGVGGQGIGLLAEVLTQACLMAGYPVRGCDTHGLAQRHGTVVSHLRLGEHARTPRIVPGAADLIVGLERLEALRATVRMLKTGGTVVYYDTVYQPIHVRTKKAAYPTAVDLEQAVRERQGSLERVHQEGLSDPRMQNVALLARLGRIEAIPGVDAGVMERALREGIPARLLEKNLAVFKQGLGADS
ncbi:MAG: 2-oxoacid:acceptor oxidoreductase family protein [Candidatus Eisenbacteria bacterium]